MGKHTQGPWMVNSSGMQRSVETDIGECIAVVSRPFPFDTKDDERDANARLIAAAPDLLAAAQAVVFAADDASLRSGDLVLPPGCQLLDDLRAAIARAEGKE